MRRLRIGRGDRGNRCEYSTHVQWRYSAIRSVLTETACRLRKSSRRSSARTGGRPDSPTDSVRRDDDHYYLFTEDGQSIDQKLIEEGLALTWDQDGQHLGWFLFKDAKAKDSESGCLWHDYQAFQRGEPNEFRIHGLTYRDS